MLCSTLKIAAALLIKTEISTSTSITKYAPSFRD
jgi:hypothetical protein